MYAESVPHLLEGAQVAIAALGSLPAPGTLAEQATTADVSEITEFFNGAYDYLKIIVGFVAIGFLAWGGYLYVSAAGNSQMAERGKNTMTAAVAGLAVVMLAPTVIAAAQTILPG